MNMLEWITLIYVVGSVALISLGLWHGKQRYSAGYAVGAVSGRAEGYREGLRIGREIRRKIVLRKHDEHVWNTMEHKDGSKWDTWSCSDCPQTRTVKHGENP